MKLDFEAAAPDAINSRKHRQKTLDECLWILEDACARGEGLVCPSVVRTLPLAVPGVTPGVPIKRAIDLVFQQQAVALAHADPAKTTESRPLDRAAARALTERIRAGLSNAALLMLEAHEQGVARTLGYGTWAEYVRHEFGFSRSRSYQLLTHGRVLQALMRDTGITEVPDISAFAAEQIAPRLADVIGEVKRRTAAGMTERQRIGIVRNVVAEFRPDPTPKVHALTLKSGTEERMESAHPARVEALVSPAEDESQRQVAAVLGAIDALLLLPADCTEVIASMTPADYRRMARVDAALAKLRDVARVWHRDRSGLHIQAVGA